MARSKPVEAPPPPSPHEEPIDPNERQEISAMIDDIPEIGTVEPSELEADLVETKPGKESIPPKPATAAGKRETTTRKGPTDQKPPEAIIHDPPEVIPEEDLDPELEKELAKIVPQTPGQQQGFTPLKNHIRRLNAELRKVKPTVEAKDKELAEIKKNTPSPEQIQQWKAIEQYVATREVESLPRWKKFDEEINSISNSATDLIKGFAAGNPALGKIDQILKVINDRGGIIKFSRSTKEAGPAWKHEDGKPMTEAEWFQEKIYNNLTKMQQNEFAALTTEAYRKEETKRKQIDEAKLRAGEVLKEESENRSQQFNTQMQSAVKEFVDKELVKLGIDASAAIEPKEDATPEQKELHERWKKADAYFTQNLTIKNPRQFGDILVRAAMAQDALETIPKLTQRAKDAEERADKLQEQLDEIENARSFRKATNAAASASKNHTKDESNMTDEEAIDANL